MTEQEKKELQERVKSVIERVNNAAVQAGRDPSEITLVAATKMNDAERVQAGLASSTIIDKKEGIQLTVGTDYTGLGKLQYLIAQQNLTLIDTVYTEKVELQLMVPAEQQQEVEKEIVEATNGSARISWGEKVLYALVDKKIEIFEKNT